jgi:hypothetical protein
LEKPGKANNAATESLNIDGRIISNQQHIAEPLIAIFSECLITSTSIITIMFTQKTNIVQILTTVIVPHNLHLKFISQITQ